MKRSHPDFEKGFVHAALIIALTSGFGTAATLAIHMGFSLPLGSWWMPLIQVHAHAQVFGWLGLFIMGVSLYFIPRFTGAPLRFPFLPRWICLLLSLGILGHSLSQPLLSLYPGALPWRWILGLSGLAEIAAVFLYILLVGLSIRRAGISERHQAIYTVRVYFISALCGWLLAVLCINIHSIRAALRNTALVDPRWNGLGLDLFTGLVLLPVAFAFSVRTFPLYLRLPAPRWSVRGLALVYLAAFALETLPVLLRLLELADSAVRATLSVQALARVAKGGAIVVFVWKLDLLLRVRPPWTVERVLEPSRESSMHPRPRPNLPDYGEFGRFERLLYAACIWLALAGLLEIYSGAAMLSGVLAPCDRGVLQHVYLAGYASLLLFGMAPRMIPGFVHVRKPAFPVLVDLTFWLAGASVILRVLPVVLPGRLVEKFPVLGSVFSSLFGISGLLGWLAVAALAGNLWATFLRGSRAPIRLDPKQ